MRCFPTCNTVHLNKYKNSYFFIRLERKRHRDRKHAQNTTHKESQCFPDQDIAPLTSPQNLHTSAADHKSSFLNHPTTTACNHSSFSGISPYHLQLPLLISTEDIIKTTVPTETGMCQNDWPFTSGALMFRRPAQFAHLLPDTTHAQILLFVERYEHLR
jgi:hypothetical protein